MIKGFNINGNIEKIDYESLENKPFYSEITTEVNKDIIPLQKIVLEAYKESDMPEGMTAGMLSLTSASVVIPNVLYNFTFDDETTQIKFEWFDGMFFAGNLGMAGMGEDTGEPYIIGLMYEEIDKTNVPMLAISCIATEGEHTIGLSYIGDTAPIIAEDTYNFELQYDSKDDYYYYDTYWCEIFGLRPQDGDKYKFTFGDTVCEITPVYDDDVECYFAGNLRIVNEDAEDTGENYLLIIYEDYIEIRPLDDGEYTVSLEKMLITTKEIVHKIDNKYLNIDVDVPYTKDKEGNVVFENDILINGGDISIYEDLSSINNNIAEIAKDIAELSPIHEFYVDSLMINSLLEVVTTTSNKSTTTKASISINFNDYYAAQQVINTVGGKLQFIKIKFDDEDTIYHIKINSMSNQFGRIEIEFAFLSGMAEFPVSGNITRNIQSICFYMNSGEFSHIEGNYTIASGYASHAEGGYTIASGDYSHVQGKYNIEDAENKYPHIVGNGVNENNRSNAHTLDWDGNAWFAGDVYIGGASQNDAAAKKVLTSDDLDSLDFDIDLDSYGFVKSEDIDSYGFSTVGRSTEGETVKIENDVEATCGVGAEIFNDYRDRAFHWQLGTVTSGNAASGEYSHAEGTYTTATGGASHAEGAGTEALGEHSHAEGSNTTASGESSHAEGAGAEALGEHSHAEGYNAIAANSASHAEGYLTNASGKYAHAEGQQTAASGETSHAEGYRTKASGEYQHVQGKWNIEDTENKYAHIVGNGTGSKYSNAHTLDWEGNAWFAGTVEGTGIILPSTTEGSTKRFLITVDDSGTLTATEIV